MMKKVLVLVLSLAALTFQGGKGSGNGSFPLLSQIIQIWRAKREVFELNLCPKERPFAYLNGDYCCRTSFEKPNGKVEDGDKCDGQAFKRSSVCCENDNYVECPSFGCHDYFPTCGDTDTVEMRNFEDDSYNGLYFSYGEYDAEEEHFLPEIVVSNRPVFRKEDKCIWWHEYNHWWMGPCSSVGQNSGYAYLSPNENCPLSPDGQDFQWRRGGSDEFIAGIGQEALVLAASDAQPSNLASSTAGIGQTRANGRFRQRCSWVYVPSAGFRCVKRN